MDLRRWSTKLNQHFCTLSRQLAFVQLLGVLVLGTATALLFPPFQTPDEPSHYSAAMTRMHSLFYKNEKNSHYLYSLFTHFGSAYISFHPETKQPPGLYTDQKLDLLKLSFSLDPIPYGNILTYPGPLLSRILVPNVFRSPKAGILHFYTSRMITGLCIVLLLWIFLQNVFSSSQAQPVHSLLAFVSAPLFLQESFSVSSDALINMSLLWLAYILLRLDRNKVFDYGMLFVILVTSFVTKPTYLPVFLSLYFGTFLLHLKSVRRFQFRLKTPGLKNPLIITGGILACSILIIVLYSKFFLVQAIVDDNKNTSPNQQIQFILSNPIQTLSVLISSCVDKITSLDVIFGPLGWGDLHLSARTRSSYLALFGLGLTLDSVALIDSFIAQTRKKLFALLSLSLGLVAAGILSAFALYVYCSPVAFPLVPGFQPRYLHPCFLGLFVFLVFFRDRHASGDSGTENSQTSILRKGFIALWIALFLNYFVSYSFDLFVRYH